MNTYSQVEQDLWVLEMLNKKKRGYFLDLGAYDGINLSNTYLLEKEYEWDGLLVEGHPTTYNQLIKTRNKEKCLNYLITDQDGIGYISEISCSGSVISNSGHKVETITLETLFHKYNVPNNIDYMSLDIEGHEYQALFKFPFSTHKCSLLTVEHNSYQVGTENKNKIYDILTKNNYVLVKNDVSCQGNIFEDWYAHKEIL
jgi:FkbM family methyltransferase